MSIIKKNLTLPTGFALKPSFDTYVRAGKVVSVSLLSRDLTVQYIDGEHDDEATPLEAVVTATVIVGSDCPETTFAPSASVYGRGDLVSVMIMGETGDRYVISPMDDYLRPNRRGYALINEWCLFDALNGLVLEVKDDGPDSFIELWDFHTHQVTRILGNPNELDETDPEVIEGKRVMRRMLDYFGTIGQPDGSFCHTLSGTYPAEVLGGGPQANPQERLLGDYWELEDETLEQFDIVSRGSYINGFKQVIDIPHGAADLTASLSAHHSTLEYLGKAKCHPLSSTTIDIYYDPTVFRFGDIDSDYVLIAAVFPAWDVESLPEDEIQTGRTCDFIHFIEIPVYSLAERKRIELDAENEGVTTHAWQLYSEDIRVLHSIERSYVEWNDLAVDFMYSERASRALPIIASRYNPTNDNHTFGILDSRSWVSGGVPLDPAKINKIIGTVKRLARPDDSYASNGSPWNYEITHNDPTTGVGIVDNWYTGRFQYYNDGAGDVWEKHSCTTPSKEYPVITDGTNEFTKKIDFLFDITGELTYNTGNQEWDDFESYSTHEWWEHFFLNGTLIYTDTYRRVHTTDPQQNYTYEVIHRILLHVDLAMGLIVAEEHEWNAEGFLIVGTTVQTVRCVVFWQGQKYIIWEMVFTDDHFPYYKNFPYPWCADNIKDGNYPERPTAVPHDFDETYSSVFFWPPHLTEYSVDAFPFNAGTRGKAMSYPYIHGECTVQVMLGKVVNDFSVEGEGPTGAPYLQVSTDIETGSWVVVAPPWRYGRYELDTTLVYPTIHDTLFCHADVNAGIPVFGKPNAANDTLYIQNQPDPIEFYLEGVVEKVVELNRKTVEPE